MTAAHKSALAFEEKLSARAHAAAGKMLPASNKEPVALVPIYIGIDRDGQQHAPETIRETFLYRYGDKQWSVKPAASRLLLETSLPGNYEKLVGDQVASGLRPYSDWRAAGKEQLVQLQIYVRHNDHIFRDEVLWDIAHPLNTADNYAIRVCADLGLGCDWCDLIRAHVHMRLEEIKQDLKEAPDEVQLQPPVKKPWRQQQQQPDAPAAAQVKPEPGSDVDLRQQQQRPLDGSAHIAAGAAAEEARVPRLEPYDPTTDLEASRVAARQQVLQIRRHKQVQRQMEMQQQQALQQQQLHPTAMQQPHPASMAQEDPHVQQQQQQASTTQQPLPPPPLQQAAGMPISAQQPQQQHQHQIQHQELPSRSASMPTSPQQSQQQHSTVVMSPQQTTVSGATTVQRQLQH